MTEQWQELKETIIELRDSDGTGTQQEVCKFLANYMDILEKQMQEPCDDAISRQSAIFLANDLKQDLPDDAHLADMVMAHNEGILEYQTQLSLLPPVNPQPKKCSVCGKGIEDLIDSREWYRNEKPNFCPFCGVKLADSQESEE